MHEKVARLPISREDIAVSAGMSGFAKFEIACSRGVRLGR
jgi:hypothetical protein